MAWANKGLRPLVRPVRFERTTFGFEGHQDTPKYIEKTS
jgi:hypothetical protein